MTATMSTDPRTDAEILADAFRAGARLTATVHVADLARAIRYAKPALPTRRYGLPILEQLRLDTRGDLLRLTASDLELTAHVEISAHITGKGVVLVGPKALAEALKGAKPRDLVTLEQTGPDMLEVIRPDGGRRTLPLGQVDEYPRLPILEPLTGALRLPVAAWARLAEAASSNEQRPPLTGVLVDGRDLVSTDSYRLHHHELTEPAPFGDQPVLISARPIRAALKTKAPFDVYVTRDSSAHQVAVIGCADVTYIGRVVDADFPNWRQLVPASTSAELEIGAAELARALRTFPDDGTTASAIRLGYDHQAGVVTLEQRSPAHATATVPVGLQCDRWPSELVIALNRSFLADLVDHVDGAVTLAAIDHLKPITCRTGDGMLIGLQMPVRVS